MRALTLHQPYASAIAYGYKRIETRSWRPSEEMVKQCQPMAIHAAKTVDLRDFFGLPLGLLQRLVGVGSTVGVIVAVANLRAVLPAAEALERWTSSRPLGVEHWERTMGDYRPGRWGWVLDSIRRLATPVPARGHHGLWKVPVDMAEQVAESARAGFDVPV